MTDRKFRLATYPFPWYGFNIQKGHIFGTVDDVLYVSGAVPGRSQTIRVYSTPRNAPIEQNWRKWEASYVLVDSPVGRRIMALKMANPGECVEVKDVRIDSDFLKGTRRRVPHKVWKKH